MPKYIAAVSGGPDSMALLHMYRKQIIAVCHVNYQKRENANRDMLIVEQFCQQENIPIEKLIVTTEKYTYYYQKYKNFQNIARKIRYDFFIENATKYQVNTVLMGHNKDDCLETAIFQIKRKSKSLYLGIESKGKYQNLNIYRPLLNKWKNELLVYCEMNHIPYGIDETNTSDIYERNRIRKALARLSLSEKENEWKRIQKFNKEHKTAFLEVRKKYTIWELHSFNIDFYHSLPNWMHEQIIYLFLTKNNINKISSNKIKLIDQFLSSNKSKTELRLGHNNLLLKIDKILILKR